VRNSGVSSDAPPPANGGGKVGLTQLGESTSLDFITVDQNWQNHLDQQIEQQRLRLRRVVERVHDRCLLVDGQSLIDFASNDYLGLSQHPQVISAAQLALERWGVGATASQMVCGYRAPQAELEQQLAHWLGVEATLIFSSGYLANMGLMMGVLGRHDVVVADKACHASLLDGIRLKGAKLLRFTHNQISHATRLLKNAEAGKRCWLVTESVFSMSGDTAPLAALATLARQYHARLIVDEAHALGVMGAEGKGVLADLALKEVIITGTFGKAFGTAGAFVGGSQLLIDYLQQTARTCTYSTALPPVIVQATLAALHQLQQQPTLVQQLQQRIRDFKGNAYRIGLPLLPSDSAIQIVPLGSSERALSLSAALAARGLWIPAIRPPTVPQGHACLRLVLSVQHSREQMAWLFEQLQQCQAAWIKA
jgi:8-amino-7-oxononanoate synthase